MVAGQSGDYLISLERTRCELAGEAARRIEPGPASCQRNTPTDSPANPVTENIRTPCVTSTGLLRERSTGDLPRGLSSRQAEMVLFSQSSSYSMGM